MSLPLRLACSAIRIPIVIVIVIVIVHSAPAQSRVMLAGGHLPVCTSMSATQCARPVTWPDHALGGHRFRIDTDSLRRWVETVADADDEPMARQWLELLVHLRDDDGPWRERGELTRLIRDARLQFPDDDKSDILGEALYQGADDQQWMRLLDHFQAPVADRREVVRLADSRSDDAIAVFERFVAMAAAVSDRHKPVIAVSTASSRDPYDALDFYLQVFEQAGAEVVWLPLDAAVRRAREADQCDNLAAFQATELGSHQRQRVWPEAFQRQLEFCQDRDAGVALIDRIDGLFLNGGDQWLTLHAFRHPDGSPTPELERILARLEGDALVLGGTSAGAAVQSGPAMISNGGNRSALLSGATAAAPPPRGCQRSGRCPGDLDGESLTYHPAGGLGSVPFAIVDTHFSERQRQLRLSRLLADSGQRFGIGVDETTALVISPLAANRFQLEVVGKAAAWLFDTSSDHQARVHRLSSGATLAFDFDAGPPASPEPASTDLSCRTFDWSTSFNELMNEASGDEVWRWCLTPAPGREFELTWRAVPSAVTGIAIFDVVLESLD